MVLLQLAEADDASLTFQRCASACTGRCVSRSLAAGPWACSTPQPRAVQPLQPGCARLSRRPRLATNHCRGEGSWYAAASLPGTHSGPRCSPWLLLRSLSLTRTGGVTFRLHFGRGSSGSLILLLFLYEIVPLQMMVPVRGIPSQ